jgi:hypothetical protein
MARISLNTLQRTYTGLLDDVMIRYSDDYSNEMFFNKMIAKNIFFGGGLYINDGYLINHPTARKYLVDEDSVLRHMLDNGFVRILTRAKEPEKLISMPEDMKKAGVHSFIESMEAVGWTNEKSEFKETWVRIAESAFFRGHARGWPSVDMGAGFTKLVDGVLTEKESPEEMGLTLIQPEDLEKFKELFFEKDPKSGAARTKYEDAANEVFKSKDNPRIFMNEMMTLANQLYHTNFGMILTSDDRELHHVGVDTVYGQVLSDYLDIQEIHEEQLNDIPLFWLPNDISFDNGSAFLPFLSETNKIGVAKQEYLQALSEVIDNTGRGSEDRKKDLRDATNNYMNRIVEILGSKSDKLELKETSGKSFSMEPSYIDSSINSTETISGLVVGLYQDKNNASQKVLLKQFHINDKSQGQTITLKDIRAQISSLTFNKSKAEEFSSDLPRFT